MEKEGKKCMYGEHDFAEVEGGKRCRKCKIEIISTLPQEKGMPLFDGKMVKEPAKDGNGGWEDKEDFMFICKLLCTACTPEQYWECPRVEKLKDFIASEIRLAEERQVARILEKKQKSGKYEEGESYEFVLVEDIVSIAKGEA